MTFLFTDIEGSTRLLQALGGGYRDVLERHSAIVRAALAHHRGVESSTEGDSFFAVFASAVDAVATAARVQRDLAGEPWPEGHQVRLRMGLHTGEGLLGSDGYVGMDVHRAARIAAAASGGQTLMSVATRALVEGALPDGASLRDLGAHRLKDLEHPEHLWQLDVAGLPDTFPPLRTLEAPSNLPTQLTSFVGREREVEDVVSQLTPARLITLTGPGGTGKTRLALRVAARVGGDFRDGAFFIDLAPLTDPALVGPAIARAVGLSERADRPIVDQLKAHVEAREMLFVLDNFEHLLAGTVIVQELLAVAPRVRILVTSRSVLDLYGEQEYAVPPLGLPEAPDLSDLTRLSSNEAVALFVERARAAAPSFAITEERAPAIVGICTRLDGLPLAIELAASRVRLLEPAEILARLEQHLPVLPAAGSNVPARQRTLASTIDWSYGLLRRSEQDLFVRLAIFAGGCTIEAADVVCNPGGELGLDTFDGLASLVAQSLLRPVPGEGAGRFGMLETIREYGRERLERDGRLDEIGRRHLAYYRDLAESAEPHLGAPDRTSWLDILEREVDDFREALGRALQLGEATDGLRLASALWRFWFQRGYLREGTSWLRDLLAAGGDAVREVRARAFSALGGLGYWADDVDVTADAYRSAVRLYREIGDGRAEAGAAYDLAFVSVMRGEAAEARRSFEAALALAQEVGHLDVVARCQHILGLIIAVGGDPEAGLVLQEQALAYFRSTGDRYMTAWTLSGLGQTYRILHDPDKSRERHLEALRINTEARSLPGIGSALDSISAIESMIGRHAEAVTLSAAASGLRLTTGALAPAMFRRMPDVEGEARRAIGDAAVDEALERGGQMALEEAIDYAMSLGR